MKKIIISILIFLFAFSVLAKTDELPASGLTPDSSFYFLKSWKESIQTFFTFGAENKAKQYLHLAEVRLAEYQKMVEKGKTEIAEKTLKKYEKQLNNALQKTEELKNKGKNVKDLSQKTEDAVTKHLEILQENLQKVPEQAKKGIENAIENSQKQIEKIGGKKDETAGWKTFRNESNGYEFKYPANIFEVVTANTIQHTLKNFHRYSAKDGSDLGLANDIIISFTKGAGECETIESSLKEIVVPFTFSNIKGLKYETGAEGEGVIYYCIKNNENKTIFSIKRWFLHGAYSTDLPKQPDFISDQEQETIADQILSTFKFISQ